MLNLFERFFEQEAEKQGLKRRDQFFHYEREIFQNCGQLLNTVKEIVQANSNKKLHST